MGNAAHNLSSSLLGTSQATTEETPASPPDRGAQLAQQLQALRPDDPPGSEQRFLVGAMGSKASAEAEPPPVQEAPKMSSEDLDRLLFAQAAPVQPALMSDDEYEDAMDVDISTRVEEEREELMGQAMAAQNIATAQTPLLPMQDELSDTTPKLPFAEPDEAPVAGPIATETVSDPLFAGGFQSMDYLPPLEIPNPTQPQPLTTTSKRKRTAPVVLASPPPSAETMETDNPDDGIKMSETPGIQFSFEKPAAETSVPGSVDDAEEQAQELERAKAEKAMPIPEDAERIQEYILTPAEPVRQPTSAQIETRAVKIRQLIFPVLDNLPNSKAYVDPPEKALVDALKASGVALSATGIEDGPVIWVPESEEALQRAVRARPSMILVKRSVRQEVLHFPREYRVVRLDDTATWIFYKLLTPEETERLRVAQWTAVRDFYRAQEKAAAERENAAKARQGAQDKAQLRKLKRNLSSDDIAMMSDSESEDGVRIFDEEEDAMEEKPAPTEEPSEEDPDEEPGPLEKWVIWDHPLEEHIRDTQSRGSKKRSRAYNSLIDRILRAPEEYDWVYLLRGVRRLAVERISRQHGITKQEAAQRTLFWIVADEGVVSNKPPPGVRPVEGVEYNWVSAVHAVFADVEFTIGIEWDSNPPKDGEESAEDSDINYFPPQAEVRAAEFIFPIFLQPKQAMKTFWRWDFGFTQVTLPNGEAELSAIFESPGDGRLQRLCGAAVVNPRIEKPEGRWSADKESENSQFIKFMEKIAQRAVFNRLVPYKGLENRTAPTPDAQLATVEALDYLKVLHDTASIQTAEKRGIYIRARTPVSMFFTPMMEEEYLLSPSYEYAATNGELTAEVFNQHHVFGSEGLMVLLDHSLWETGSTDKILPQYDVPNKDTAFAEQISPAKYSTLTTRVLEEWASMASGTDRLVAFLEALKVWRSYNQQLKELDKELTRMDLQLLRILAKKWTPLPPAEPGVKGATPEILEVVMTPEEIEAAYAGPLTPVVREIPEAEDDISVEEMASDEEIEYVDRDAILEEKEKEEVARRKARADVTGERFEDTEAIGSVEATDTGAAILLYADWKAAPGRRRLGPAAAPAPQVAGGAVQRLEYDTANPKWPFTKAFKVLKEDLGFPQPSRLVIPPGSAHEDELKKFTLEGYGMPVPARLYSDEVLKRWSYARPAYAVVYGRADVYDAELQRAVDFVAARWSFLDGIVVLDPEYEQGGADKKRASAAKLRTLAVKIAHLLQAKGISVAAPSVFAPVALVYSHRLQFNAFVWGRGPFKVYTQMNDAHIADKTGVDAFVDEGVDPAVLKASRTWGLPPILSNEELKALQKDEDRAPEHVWAITTQLGNLGTVVDNMLAKRREGLFLVSPIYEDAEEELTTAVGILVAEGGQLAGWKSTVSPPFAVIWANEQMRKKAAAPVIAARKAAEKAAKGSAAPKAPRAPKRKAEDTLESEAKRVKILDEIFGTPDRLVQALSIALRGLFTAGSYVAVSHAGAVRAAEAEETVARLKILKKVKGSDFQFNEGFITMDATRAWEEYTAHYADFIKNAQKQQLSLVVVCLDKESTLMWLQTMRHHWPAAQKPATKKADGEPTTDAMEVDQPTTKKAAAPKLTPEEYALRHIVILGPPVTMDADTKASVTEGKDLWTKYGKVTETIPAGTRDRSHLEWVEQLNVLQQTLHNIPHGPITEESKVDYRVFIGTAVYYWRKGGTDMQSSSTKDRVAKLASCHGGRRRTKGYK